MRKYFVVVGVLVALAVPVTAVAATLSNANGQSCGEGQVGVWHFVNNQTDGAGPGTLNAVFSGGITASTGPSKVLSSTQHFFVTTDGAATLISATTNLPGRLVLSDFTCTGTKDGGGKK